MYKNNPYTSGEYYKETYIPRRMTLEQSTRWSSNYFAVVKNIFPEINNFKNKTILEIGSGFGGFINILNQKGFNDVTASDMSTSIFSDKLKNKLMVLDLTDSSSLETRYDIIFAFDVMEHINETEKAIKKISQILQKEGYFIFSTPYPIKKHLLDNYHTNMQFSNYYSNIFKQNGFKVITIEEVSFVPFIWRLKIPIFLKTIVKSKLFISETFFVFKKIKNNYEL